MTTQTSIPSVDTAIRSRRSIRNFLPTPVPRELLAEILELAARAPSGTNVQPWKVYALTGAPKAALSAAILEKYERGEMEGREFDYYPKEWKDPWHSRRKKIGLGLYGLLGIAKDDKARMKHQTGRNYVFFDAPVGLIFTMDRCLGEGMFLDYGMFMGNLMIAARARASTPAPSSPLPTTPEPWPPASACPTTNGWCAAWPWVMPTPKRRKTSSSPNASR